MGALLGFFFFIIILILVLGLSIIGGVLRFIFGFGRKSTQRAGSHYENEANHESDEQPAKKKIFDKEDGEYVDFEEIKEDK